MLIFLQFIPAKQEFHSSSSLKFFRGARAEACCFKTKGNFSGASCYVAVKVCFFAANFAMHMMLACVSGL